MAAVNETCACGSTLTYSGDSLHTSWAMRDFRSAHEGCRTPAPTPPPPPDAEPSCTCSTDPLDRMPLIDGRCPVHSRPTAKTAAKPRLRGCVEAWPDCETGEYNPACCRFPKSCSATVYDPSIVTPDDLEEPHFRPGKDGA